MVGGAIAFNRQQILPRTIWMAHPKVDPEPCRSDLWIGQIAERADCSGDVFLERTVGIEAVGNALLHGSGLGKSD